MRKALHITVILVFILSCSNSKKADTSTLEVKANSVSDSITIKENRVLIIFDVETFVRTEKYELTIVNSENAISYHYKNLSDEDKNMDFKFDKNSNWLYFSDMPFQLVKKNEYLESKLSKTNFDLYEMIDQMDDGNGPMLFNKDYGILNFDNGWGRFFVYLKTNNDSILAKELILKVYQ